MGEAGKGEEETSKAEVSLLMKLTLTLILGEEFT